MQSVIVNAPNSPWNARRIIPLEIVILSAAKNPLSIMGEILRFAQDDI